MTGTTRRAASAIAIASLALGAVGGPAPAQVTTIEPARSIVAVYDDGKFRVEIAAVSADTVSVATTTGATVTQRMEGCISARRLDGPQFIERCGPLTVEIDPLLETGRVVGRLGTGTSAISVDVLVTATSAPTATTDHALDELTFQTSATVERLGEVAGTIRTAFGETTDLGSSWYGKLVAEGEALIAAS